MEKYNYFEAVKADVLDYINENEIKVTTSNRDDIEQQLNDDLFCNDSVTGNASGSYTFNTWQAEENICHNLDLLGEALKEFRQQCRLSGEGGRGVRRDDPLLSAGPGHQRGTGRGRDRGRRRRGRRGLRRRQGVTATGGPIYRQLFIGPL